MPAPAAAIAAPGSRAIMASTSTTACSQTSTISARGDGRGTRSSVASNAFDDMRELGRRRLAIDGPAQQVGILALEQRAKKRTLGCVGARVALRQVSLQQEIELLHAAARAEPQRA